jgi:histone H3/H4
MSIEIALKGIRKPAIRRLCRKAGIQRIHNTIYRSVRMYAKHFLEERARRALIMMEHARRHTVMKNDIKEALATTGNSIYEGEH